MTPSATMSNETDSYPPSPRDVDASSTVASSLYLDHSSASRRPRRKQDLRRFATQCAVVDDPDSDHHDQHGSSSVPIYQTATFKGACVRTSLQAVLAGLEHGVTAVTPTDLRHMPLLDAATPPAGLPGQIYDYSRSGNPTRTFLRESLLPAGRWTTPSYHLVTNALSQCAPCTPTLAEHHIAKISNAKHAFVVSSGMAALDVIFRSLKPGDEIITGEGARPRHKHRLEAGP